MGVRSFGPSDVLAWFLLSLRRLLVCLLLRVEFQGLRGGWLRPLLRDFDLLDLFHWSSTGRRRLYLPRGVFNFSFSPDTRWSALGIFGDNPWLAVILWFVFLLSTHANLWRLGLSQRPVWLRQVMGVFSLFTLLLFLILQRSLLMDYGAFIYLGVYYGSCISGPYSFLYWFGRLQGLGGCWCLVIPQRFCLGSCFQWHHLIPAFTPAGGLRWMFSSSLRCMYLQMSFFSSYSRLSFEWSWFSCLAIRGLYFVLFSTLRCFPGSCPLGCSCQPERLHRRPLAIAITVASVSDIFFLLAGLFTFRGVHTCHLCFLCAVMSVSFPGISFPSMVDQFLVQSFLWCFCLLTHSYLRPSLLVLGSP